MQIGGYEIEARLGRGGMAEVFLGRVVGGPRAGSAVALKRLLPALARDPEHVALFEREARLAERLHHPAIVEVVASGAEAGLPYLVMEYVDGTDLSRLLAACRRRGFALPLDFALHAGHQVAEALAAAHAARDEAGRPLGVVHCDVSPSNVFVSRVGAVKLGDFGVARAAGDAAGRAALGKVRYLAPELLRGEPVSPAVDLFGLGATLFELLTGERAFPGDDATRVAAAIASGARPRAAATRPEVSPQVDALLQALLAADPAARPADAAEVAAALGVLYDERVGTPLAIAALVRAVMAT